MLLTEEEGGNTRGGMEDWPRRAPCHPRGRGCCSGGCAHGKGRVNRASAASVHAVGPQGMGGWI
eukprot:scaffold1947_cov65-Phaeocystis_antarctica.AAC.3